MKRPLSKWMAAPLLAIGAASSANAQVADPGYAFAFFLWGLITVPEQARDFETVVYFIIKGSSENADPFMVNDLNLTFQGNQDDIDPSAF